MKVNIWSDDKFMIDGHEISAKQLARDLKIRGVPAVFFFKNDHTIITAIPGYVSTEKFEKILRFVGEEHYQKMTIDEYMKSS